MASIAFKSVCKRYGDVDAVKQLELSCASGEMLALLGPSGCGKSTTLKMAAGIEEVTAGEIYFGERPVTHLSPGERNIAMVFEDYALYPRMTVWDNVAFPLKVRGLVGQPAAQRIGEVLDLLGLRDLADRNVRGLSGGAQQRVAIGRALLARASSIANITLLPWTLLTELIVAEGYMDVIGLAQGGFAQAVAPLGTALTEDQISELWRLVAEPILCFDGDAAGQRAAIRGRPRCRLAAP